MLCVLFSLSSFVCACVFVCVFVAVCVRCELCLLSVCLSVVAALIYIASIIISMWHVSCSSPSSSSSSLSESLLVWGGLRGSVGALLLLEVIQNFARLIESALYLSLPLSPLSLSLTVGLCVLFENLLENRFSLVEFLYVCLGFYKKKMKAFCCCNCCCCCSCCCCQLTLFINAQCALSVVFTLALTVCSRWVGVACFLFCLKFCLKFIFWCCWAFT